MAIVLHSYWRSSAAYRVRIALAIKNLPYSQVTHDLRRQAQNDPAYLRLAPHGLVPALEIDGLTLIESQAILDYLDERFPNPPLLPADLGGRAIVRSMAALVACDIHPLNNLAVLNRLRTAFNATDDAVSGWIATWIGRGFTALESLIVRHGGRFAFGDTAGLADIMLVPQLYNAERFACDLSVYPRLVAAGAAARALPAFAAAVPELQPDAG